MYQEHVAPLNFVQTTDNMSETVQRSDSTVAMEN